jgi:PAS domain S-box-containing protein
MNKRARKNRLNESESGPGYLKPAVNEPGGTANPTSIIDFDITRQKKGGNFLKNSEEKFRIITENSADAIFITDQRGRYLYTNKEVSNMLGYSPDEMKNKTIADLSPVAKIEEYIEFFNHILSVGKGFTEIELLKKDGNYISTDLNIVLLPDGLVYGSCRDISKRKKAEKDLAELSQFNLQIINCIDEGIIVYDRNLRYLGWNPFMEELTGLPASQVLGKYAHEVFPFLEEAGVLNVLKRTLKGEIIEATDFPFTLPDSGKSGWACDKNVALRNVKGEITGVIGTVQDISVRKKSEEKLRQINERFVLATTAASISVWEHDFSTDVIQVDDNFNKIYGTPENNYQIGFSQFNKSIHPDDAGYIKANIEEAVQSDKNINFEFRIIRPDGNIRTISAYGRTVKDTSGKPVKFIGVNTDISDIKRAELAIKENERKLLQLNIDKDRFISILSHDLRSHFNNILGLTELLLEVILKPDIDEIKEIAKNINQSAHNSYKLLEDILLWAKTQQGRIPFKPQILSFRDICIEILNTLNPNANAKNITINYSASDNTKVFADIDMLKTILRNLVSNAIKFTNNGGTIIIDAKQNSGNVTITVSDNGIGIPHDILVKLFEISEVITTRGTAKETGTGLGLLICKEFIDKHNGEIWVRSELAKGSEFNFTLPLLAE